MATFSWARARSTPSFSRARLGGAVGHPALQVAGQGRQLGFRLVAAVQAVLRSAQHGVHGAHQQAQLVVVVLARQLDQEGAGPGRVHLADGGGDLQQRLGDHGVEHRHHEHAQQHGAGGARPHGLEDAGQPAVHQPAGVQAQVQQAHRRHAAVGGAGLQRQGIVGDVAEQLLGQGRQRGRHRRARHAGQPPAVIVVEYHLGHRLVLEQAAHHFAGQLGRQLVGGLHCQAAHQLQVGGVGVADLRMHGAVVGKQLVGRGQQAQRQGDG
ncbi:MAG: hypothetical protein NVV74_06975 [Magnetospirillum sp.]|nr:hypothetical protein [Magnetospirillum sp.]